ncbi:hypothetical protein ABID76_006270 [Burkholderia ambifaria]
MQRCEQYCAQPEDVRHRRIRVDLVVGTQCARLRGHTGEMQHATVGHHHALGHSRSAGRENDGSHVACQRLRLDPCRDIHSAAHQAAHTRRACAVPRGMAGGSRRHVRSEIQHARVGLAGERVDLTRCHARIDAARPCADAAARDQQCRMLGAVLGHHQHAVAGTHAVGPQFMRERIRQRADVRITQRAVGEMDERPLRCVGQPAIQQFVNACGHARFSLRRSPSCTAYCVQAKRARSSTPARVVRKRLTGCSSCA